MRLNRVPFALALITVLGACSSSTQQAAPATARTTAPTVKKPASDGPLSDALVSAAAANVDALAMAGSALLLSTNGCVVGSFGDFGAGRPSTVPDFSGRQRGAVKLKDDGHGVLRCFFDTASNPGHGGFEAVVAVASDAEIASLDSSISSETKRTPGDAAVGGTFYTRCPNGDSQCLLQWVRGNLDLGLQLSSEAANPHIPDGEALAWLSAQADRIVRALAVLDPASVNVGGELGS